MGAHTLTVGQIVEVLSAEEIFATLDERGMLDSLPFMPEMARHCGRRFTVSKVANKLCDTMTHTGMRRMNDAVYLDGMRCDGSGHDGCEAACLLYWKAAWLRPVAADASTPTVDPGAAPSSTDTGVVPPGARLLVLVDTNATRTADDGTKRFVCQATELLRAAPDQLRWRQFGQHIQDVRVGNVSVAFAARAFLVGTFNRMQGASKRLPARLRFRDARPWRFVRGRPGPTPTAETGLQPGDLVRIRSKEEIMATLNEKLLNRGLGFEAEMARFCGRTARVARRVNRIIEEPTGRMIEMKYPCIVLEGVVCEGAYNASCPRGIPSYWREIWLERLPEPA